MPGIDHPRAQRRESSALRTPARRAARPSKRRIAEVRLQPSVTPDGVHVRLLANVEGVRDLQNLETDAIAGIGLFRTEFAFMERRQFPTENEQVAMYRLAMEGANGKPVTFRTLDVGGDKPLGYFRMPEERNPVLGWRGIRLCLDWPDILYTQMRAILRASALGHARILLPMVTSRSEVVRCREVLEQLVADLRSTGVPHDPKIELGVMVEVPVLVPVLPDILPIVSTSCRLAPTTSCSTCWPSIATTSGWPRCTTRSILGCCACCSRSPRWRAAGKSASICGEIAGDHWFTPILVGLGYTRAVDGAGVLAAREADAAQLPGRRVPGPRAARRVDAVDGGRSAPRAGGDPGALGAVPRRAGCGVSGGEAKS
jgi:phosphotransferase system enzyme I (PtsI)